MALIRMRVIPEPALGSRTVLAPTSARHALFSSNGPNSYCCGSCGTTLLEKMHYKQVADVVIRCAKCGAFNEIPTAHHAH